MIFPFRHRIGMAALISACLILALCFFRGEMFFMRKSRVVEYTADDRFSLKVYTNYFNFGFPGQGSDVPCYVVLCRNLRDFESAARHLPGIATVSSRRPYQRSAQPLTFNQKPETRNQKPETRNSKPETRNPKLETPKLPCRSQN